MYDSFFVGFLKVCKWYLEDAVVMLGCLSDSLNHDLLGCLDNISNEGKWFLEAVRKVNAGCQKINVRI